MGLLAMVSFWAVTLWLAYKLGREDERLVNEERDIHRTLARAIRHIEESK